MKPIFRFSRQLRPDHVVVIALLSASGSASGQQNVFHRSDAGTGDWGSANLPWFFGTNDNRGDPDNDGATRNDVFIGHNNNTEMTVNGRFYIHRDFTFQSEATTGRSISAFENGGFSFTRSLINESTATHTFNAPVGIDSNFAEIRNDNSSGSLTFNGIVYTNGNQTFVRGPGNTTFAGEISGAGSFVKQGTGTMTFTGAADYSGSLFIDAGKLTLERTIGSTGALDIGSGVQEQTANAATLEIGSNIDIARQVIVRNAGSGAGSRSIVFSNQTGTASLSGSVSLDKNIDISSDGTGAELSGTITGNGGINVSGPGTLVLSGANQYSGTTAVSQGTLVINGNQSAATGALTVSSGATLRGTGTIGGTTEIAGTHSTGTTAGEVGNQNVSGNLSYTSGSIFEWDLNAPSTSNGFDTVTGIGSNTMSVSGGTIQIVLGSGADFGNAFWNQNQTWAWTNIFKNFESVRAFQNFTVSNAPSSSLGSFTTSGSGVEWVAVPEPRGALAGFLIVAGLLRRRRPLKNSAR